MSDDPDPVARLPGAVLQTPPRSAPAPAQPRTRARSKSL